MSNNLNGGTGMNPQTQQTTPTGWDISELEINESSFLDETVTCANVVYNQTLVQSGQVSNMNEAKQVHRNIDCNCGGCKTCNSVGFIR